MPRRTGLSGGAVADCNYEVHGGAPDLPRGQAVRLVPDQHAKDVQARRLRKRRQADDCNLFIHPSGTIDVFK